MVKGRVRKPVAMVSEVRSTGSMRFTAKSAAASAEEAADRSLRKTLLLFDTTPPVTLPAVEPAGSRERVRSLSVG